MSIAIRTEHLSKEYRLGTINHGMLFRDIQSWMARKRGKPDPHEKIGAAHYEDQADRFWALKDVSFDIEQGDRVGIIGRNGAGKSTLLKILSRITAPTEGRVKIKGRIVSLLEVGTGFHPELTGRENIYLNGAILGMKKRQVAKKMDEIIAFSEIEKFIDTPVKRYSSGMYVRLAFAVAAHLDSDILLADEVLAVGDAAFQKKCLGKMEEVSKNQGRTVIFVSHNMNAVESLCSSGIFLESGRISFQSPTIKPVISRYFQTPLASSECTEWTIYPETKRDPAFTPLRLAITDRNGVTIKNSIRSDEDFYLCVDFSVEEVSPSLAVGFALYSEDGMVLFYSYSTDMPPEEWVIAHTGHNRYLCKLPKGVLNEGKYRIELQVPLHKIRWIWGPNDQRPSVIINIAGGISRSPYWHDIRPTAIAPCLDWIPTLDS